MKKTSNLFLVALVTILTLASLTACGKQDSTSITPATPPSSTSNTNQFSPLSYQGVEGQDALTLLKKDHIVQTKSFGEGMGDFVEVIDGIAPTTNEFWAFYVNGKIGQVGASSYITKPGETIEWKLEKVNN